MSSDTVLTTTENTTTTAANTAAKDTVAGDAAAEKAHIGVVVGVDGSPSARAAAQWAAQEAARQEVPLLLAAAYVVPQFLYAEGMVPSQAIFRDLTQQAQEFIDQAAAAINELALELEIVQEIREGSPITMLLELSREADVLVVGSRGWGGFAGAILGSVSASVVRHAHCPVVVIREDMHTKRGLARYADGPIVVGADGSEVSTLALQEAFAMAARQRAPLVAVNAWLDRGAQSSMAMLNLSANDWQRAQQEQEALVASHIAPYVEQYPTVEHTISVRRETPELTLSKAAHKARLLVVGSHGRGGFTGMLLGSTSRALLRLADCPLMVVRSTADK